MAIAQNFPKLKPTLNLDFANTKALDPRITFTRASTATYYDGKTYAKAEENLLTWSQDFNNAVWSKFGSVKILSSVDIAPDGTITANKLVEAAATQWQAVGRNNINISAGNYTATFYAKAHGRSWVGVDYNDGTTGAMAYFNLSGSGSVGTVSSPLSASIASVGNGWYRCTISRNYAYATSGAQFYIFATTGNEGTLVTGNGSDGVLIWGAQLEQRSSATAYTPTTSQPVTKYQPQLLTAAASVPRFDHDPITGESKGLLIEEQRTNLATYSDQFDNVAWGKSGATITANTTIAPDGSLSADTIAVNQTNAFGFIYSGTTNLAGASTSSIYAKKGSQRYLQILSTAATAYWANFDLEIGTAYSGGNATASIVHVGNGWYRCSMSINDASTNNQFTVGFVPSLNAARAQTFSTNTFAYIWGAQLEAGSFATSYIPTTSAQVTRSTDSASITGSNFSSWYRQDEGTLFAKHTPLGSLYFSSSGVADIDNSKQLQRSFIIAAYAGTLNAGAQYKSATSYNLSGSSYASRNGSSSYANVAYPNEANRLNIGIGLAYYVQSGHISNIVYYPKQLTNADLDRLTK